MKEGNEKERILFEHNLNLRRVFFEKFLIAIVLVIAAIAGNLLIEKYKKESTQEKFLLEERLSSVYEIRKTYSEITKMYYNISARRCQIYSIINNGEDLLKEKAKLLRSKITETMNVVNRESILFSPEFQENANLVLNLLLGISYEPHQKFCGYREFVSEISKFLNVQLRKELGLSTFKVETYIPISITKEQLDQMGANKYLSINLNKWKLEMQ